MVPCLYRYGHAELVDIVDLESEKKQMELLMIKVQLLKEILACRNF